jgi:hypothetical protein
VKLKTKQTNEGTLLLNGMRYRGEALLALDWSRTLVTVYDPRRDKTSDYASIEEVAEANPGCSFVLEATAESYELQRRPKVIRVLKANQIDDVFVFKTKFTKDYRLRHNITKTDAHDAKVIYKIATETRISLSRFKPLRDGDEIGSRISAFAIDDRRIADGKNSVPYARKYFGVARITKKSPSPVAIPPEFVDWVCDSTGHYRKQVGRILYAAERVRKAGRGYREFRRQLGNYGNGYHRIMRSEVNWWLVRTRLQAAMRAKQWR